jgi:hypothetical protein
MERTQAFFKLNKKQKTLEFWFPYGSTLRPTVKFIEYNLSEEEMEIAKKLMARDFKSAILYRRHQNEGIAKLALDIIENRG